MQKSSITSAQNGYWDQAMRIKDNQNKSCELRENIDVEDKWSYKEYIVCWYRLQIPLQNIIFNYVFSCMHR